MRVLINGCTHVTHTRQDTDISRCPRKFLLPLLSQFHPSTHPALGTTVLMSVHHRFVLPVLEFHTRGITRHVLFCIWLLLLRIMFLRFAMLLLLVIPHSFCRSAAFHCANRLYISFSAYRHLCCFQRGVITDKAVKLLEHSCRALLVGMFSFLR